MTKIKDAEEAKAISERYRDQKPISHEEAATMWRVFDQLLTEATRGEKVEEMPDWENGANQAKSDIFLNLKAILGDGYMGSYNDLIEAIDDLIKIRIGDHP